MAEAEDVIVDAARHVTSYAMDLWRRNRASDPEPGGVALADVRGRLELLLEAALGAPVPIRAASPPAPRTLLSRLLERDKRERSRDALPGTDGDAIYLPPRFCAEEARALDLYRISALHQGMRLIRQTARLFPWTESLLVQDLFLVGETAAVEVELVQRLPGLGRTLNAVRLSLVPLRPVLDALDEPLRSVEALYRSFLGTGGMRSTHGRTDPASMLAWARRTATKLSLPSRYAGLTPDALLGVVLQPSAWQMTHIGSDTLAPSAHRPRVAKIARRPRARKANDDEDDENTGVWMIQTSQPSEHAEDPMGLQRPVDKEPESDLDGAGESMSDLDELRLVSSPGTPREIFAADDPLPVRGARAASAGEASSKAVTYPEWDYTISAYRERAAVVRMLQATEGSAKWVAEVVARHRTTLTRVRRRFEALRSRRALQHAQPEGDELDIEALVSAHANVRARLPRNDRLYLTHRSARRDFALLLLIDSSGSTDAWVGNSQRIIDVEKEALVIVSTALDALRVRFAVHAFSGYGAQDVRMREVKSFEDRFEPRLARRVAALEPEEYTRAGAALRHATAALMREPAYRRLLLLLSDGKPNDCDRYEGRYGMEDTRQALAEAKLQGIAPFCVTVDRQASRHLALLFGPGNYTVVREPGQLTAALLDWVRNVTLAAT